MKKSEIFSGENSREMWDAINNAKTIRDLKDALYSICCKLQEFETRVKELEEE